MRVCMTVFHQEALHQIQETASIVMNFSYILAFVHVNLELLVFPAQLKHSESCMESSHTSTKMMRK